MKLGIIEHVASRSVVNVSYGNKNYRTHAIWLCYVHRMELEIAEHQVYSRVVKCISSNKRNIEHMISPCVAECTEHILSVVKCIVSSTCYLAMLYFSCLWLFNMFSLLRPKLCCMSC